MHRADGWGLDVVMTPAQFFADLRRAPTRMLAPQLHDQRLDLYRQLIGVAVGSATSTGQAIEA
jgi:hypothetical protein